MPVSLSLQNIETTMDLLNEEIRPWDATDVAEQFGDSLTLLPSNDNIKELQSILRDK